MSVAQLSLELDAQSIWAVLRGDERTLSIIEDTLLDKISQGLGVVKRRSMQPWFRAPGALHVMAGLIPWCWPEKEYPLVWNESSARLDAALNQLTAWGWRGYQVDAVRSAVLAPLGRGVVSVGTGGGKTRICWGIAFVCGGEWQYVVHGKDIVRQAGEAFSELSNKYAPVNIRAWSWSRLPVVGSGLLVDECHQAAARNRSERLGAGCWGWRITAGLRNNETPSGP